MTTLQVLLRRLAIALIIFNGFSSVGHAQSVTIQVVSPKPETNSLSTPEVRWTCAEPYTEARILLTGPEGGGVFDSDWQHIAKGQNNICTVALRKRLGELIIPPLEPRHCSPKEICIKPPTHWGLRIGRYTLELHLRGGGASDGSARHEFEVKENLVSTFSEDAAGWTPIRGQWEALLGQYIVSGDSRGAQWLTRYNGGPVDDTRRDSDLSGARQFEARLTVDCSDERCYGGLAPFVRETGSTAGKKYYTFYEVVLTGDRRLIVQRRWEQPAGEEKIASIDVKQHVQGKRAVTLTVDMRPGKFGVVLVRIDGQVVLCQGLKTGHNEGQVGLVFVSKESTERMEVNEVVVRPTRLAGSQWCYYRVPSP